MRQQFPPQLVLVRHGRTVPDPDTPASRWPLQDPGSCRALARCLPDLPVVASTEDKAVATARALGREFSIDARLREVSRPFTPDAADFEAMIAAYLRGDSLPGWEPQLDALGRFTSAVRGIVVSHGTVMSLYVGAVFDLDAFEFWQNLETPDAWELTEEGSLVRLAAEL